MSAERRRSAGVIGRRALLVWGLLVGLTVASLLAAYRTPAPWATALNFGIAATQLGLVALLFMRLDRATNLVRLAAACGLFWLAILFALTLADTLSRLANT